jgi:GNAT superfamily N-acetyltransferase
MSQPTWVTRPVEQRDKDAWQHLFGGYCEFYEQPCSEELLRRVWSWIHDDRSVEAIVAVPADDAGDAVGLAHLRPWVRPLRGQIAGYLDDIFVDPAVRGTGVVEALFAAIDATAVAHGWSIVRWTTADDNYRARTAYDRVATRTGWITYELTPGELTP